MIFSKFGDVKSIKILLKNYCAFVTYSEREHAEFAMTALFNKCMIKGQKYKLMWGRPTLEKKDDDDITLNEGKNIAYKTECQIYDNSSMVYQSGQSDLERNNINLQSQVKNYYPLNLNSYSNQNVGNRVNNTNNQSVNTGKFHPYYPSMNKNAMV